MQQQEHAPPPAHSQHELMGDTAARLHTFLAAHSRPSSAPPGRRPTSSCRPTSQQQQHGRQRITTAAQALQHYAHHGLDAQPRLVYLAPAQQQQQHGHGASSFCSISATGVVQAVRHESGGDSTTHTPACAWLRQASLTEVFGGLAAASQLNKGAALRRCAGRQQQRCSRQATTGAARQHPTPLLHAAAGGGVPRRWHATARRARYERHRRQLSQRLLLLKPAFLRTLQDCRRHLDGLQAAGALAAMPPGAYRLDALLETQQEWQTCARFEPAQSLALALMQHACRAACMGARV